MTGYKRNKVRGRKKEREDNHKGKAAGLTFTCPFNSDAIGDVPKISSGVDKVYLTELRR